MPFVSRLHGEIFYDVKGYGEPLVMLRGLGRSSRYWLGYDEYLAQYFRVITIDQRGIGQSTAPLNWLTTIEDMAEDVIDVLNAVGVDAAHVFGLSLGGMIAMAMGAKYPSYCRRLIIANSSSADSSPSRIKITALKQLIKAAIKGNTTHRTLMELVTTKRVEQRIGYEILNRWREIVEEEGIPIETALKQLVSASRFRIKGRIDTTLVPTLILYGNQDQFVPTINSKQLHTIISGSKLKVIRGVGHEITIGQEELLKNIIVGFTECRESVSKAI